MPENIEFGKKAHADDFRDEFEEHLCSNDDRRLKTVTLADDAPDQVVQEAKDRALLDADDTDDTPYAELAEGERNHISEKGGFSQEATVGSWRKAKGVFQREGAMDQWSDAIPSLVDWEDPVAGAEEYLASQREAAAAGRTSGPKGREDTGRDQTMSKAKDAAERVDAERCNHAEDKCRSGVPDACEHLQDVCGYSEQEVEQLLDAGPLDSMEDAWDDDRLLTDEDDGELPGKVLGALKDLWGGYKGHITQAKQSAAAINEIRMEHGQDPLEFRELGDRAITPNDSGALETDDVNESVSDGDSDPTPQFIADGAPDVRGAASWINAANRGTQRQQRFMEVVDHWAGTVANSYDDLMGPVDDLAFVTVGNHNSDVNVRRIVETAIYENTESGLETPDTQQQNLAGDTDDSQQSQFPDGETGDTKTRHEEEAASSLLEDDRSDPSRGVSSESDSGEQRQFSDPEQEGLGE